VPDGDHARLTVFVPVVDAVESAPLEHVDGVFEGETSVLERAVAFAWVECNFIRPFVYPQK
jgi:hypothetical protein